MRTLLLPSLFALAVGLTGIISASAMIGPGISNKAGRAEDRQAGDRKRVIKHGTAATALEMQVEPSS